MGESAGVDIRGQDQPNLMYSRAHVRSGALQRAATFGALTLSVTTLARAQPASESLEVSGFGSCPDPATVHAAILQLTSASSRAALPKGSAVFVNDQGESFRVSITTEGSNAERTYADPGRSCERRARFAAVFAIVTLMPPDLETEAEPKRSEPPKVEPPPTPPKPPVAPQLTPTEPTPTSAPPWLRLALAGVAEQALDPDAHLALRGFGAELIGVVGRSRLAPAFSVGFAPKRELTLPETRCELTRVEIMLGARLNEPLGAIDFGVDTGVAFAWSRLRGSELAHPEVGTALDLGLRARASASFGNSRVSPLLGIEAALFPFSTEVRGAPQGELGRLPLLWLGVTLGIEARF